MAIDLLDDVFDLPDASPGMNDDLAAWAAEHDVASAEAPRSRAVTGRCALCRSPADRLCVRCERTVCVQHHHVMVGLCDTCREDPDRAADAGPGDAEEGPLDAATFRDERPPPRPDLDLDWIE